MAEITACKFQVFGKVQKVFFRKYTEETANHLGLKGWVMNTPEGTVVGEMEGSADKIEEMKHWLSTKGSPKSIIEKAQFSEERIISEHSFKNFEFRR